MPEPRRSIHAGAGRRLVAGAFLTLLYCVTAVFVLFHAEGIRVNIREPGLTETSIVTANAAVGTRSVLDGRRVDTESPFEYTNLVPGRHVLALTRSGTRPLDIIVDSIPRRVYHFDEIVLTPLAPKTDPVAEGVAVHAVSLDGRLLAVTNGVRIRILSIPSPVHEEVAAFDLPERIDIRSLRWTPDRTLIVLAGDRILLAALRQPVEVRSLPVPGVEDITFVPGQEVLLARDASGSVSTVAAGRATTSREGVLALGTIDGRPVVAGDALAPFFDEQRRFPAFPRSVLARTVEQGPLGTVFLEDTHGSLWKLDARRWTHAGAVTRLVRDGGRLLAIDGGTVRNAESGETLLVLDSRVSAVLLGARSDALVVRDGRLEHCLLLLRTCNPLLDDVDAVERVPGSPLVLLRRGDAMELYGF